MNTLQINTLLSEYECFIGTFSRDLLPIEKIQVRPCALIVNTDESTKPGEHWVAIYLNETTGAEYFDSFGFMPMHKEIINFFKINKIKKIVYNSNQIQSISSNTCGAYCVLFVKFKCLNYSFCDLINCFSNNLYNNDLKIFYSLII
jgi:hypothetical protein